MNPDLLNPTEAWDAAEQDIHFWQEEKDRKERRKWRMLRGY